MFFGIEDGFLDEFLVVILGMVWGFENERVCGLQKQWA
jgi:hypothetical protein